MRTISFLALLAALGCTNGQQIERSSLSVANPTSWVFDIPLHPLRDSILVYFDLRRQMPSRFLDSIGFRRTSEDDPNDARRVYLKSEVAETAVFGAQFFQNAGLPSDIYLHSFHDSWDSRIYHSKDKSFQFRAEFALRFERVTETSTRISVVTLNPRVLNGIAGYTVHGSYPKEDSVASTTVEEYTILQYIGHELNAQAMPPLCLPVQ